MYIVNKSHAACYAFIAYQTAWLKANYPVEYMAALLTVFGEKREKLENYIKECGSMGIEILQPDVNHSDYGFSVKDGKLLFGLESIKSISGATIDEIINKRPFTDFVDFVDRVEKRKVNKAKVKALVYSGSFDSLFFKLNPEENKYTFKRINILSALFTILGHDDDFTEEISNWNKVMELELENEYIGMYITGHPLDSYAHKIVFDYLPYNDKVETHVLLRDFKIIKTKKGDDMAFLTVDTLDGIKEMTMFPNQYATLKRPLVNGVLMKVRLYKKYNSYAKKDDLYIDAINVPYRINKDKYDKAN